MSILSYEHKNHFRIIPGLTIFAEILFFILLIPPFFIDSILDFREGTFSLQETYIFFGFLIIMWGSFGFVLFYFLFSIIHFDFIDRIKIYSRFSQKKYNWDEIDSITFIISKTGGSVSTRHGLLMIFLMPYFFHTRMVYISLKTISGNEIHIWLQINLNKVNGIFYFLKEFKNFNVNKTQINFSKLKGKKYSNPIRDQWQFQRSNSYQSSISQEFYIRNNDGKILQKSYSKNAKIMIGFGAVSTINLLVIYYLFASHILFAENPVIWYTFIIFGGTSFLIGFIYSFITPEMKKKRELI
ncbi:MAG: hypothetical protein ACTSWL_02730 [Promethearchaeota archaeon]